MIKTLFFPFSHISKDQLRIVTAFFPNLGILPLVPDFNSDPVLASLAEQDILQPIFALPGELDLVEKQVHSYLDWAQLHRGNERNLKSLLKEQPYFMDATGLSSIQSQIRKGTQKNEGPLDQKAIGHKKAGHDPLLLLKFAQLLDAQNEGIDDELRALEQSNASLFSELKGEQSKENAEKLASGSCASGSVPLDPGSIMTKERVESWFRYAEQKDVFKLPGATPLLITTSPAVFDYMKSKSDVINALDIDSIKVHENGCENKCKWQHDFYQFLQEIIVSEISSGIAQPEVDDRCLLSGHIKLCLFPGDCMEEFFNISDQSLAVCLVQLKS
ncbi:MAG: hypothetical protein GY860_03660 [Desulfobacteraceae bacterium]|nr:hypothetical protein [Desulfobacteraceae bacterium]